MKQIIIAVVVIVAIVGGAIFFSSEPEADTGATSNNFYGAEQGVITVTEYADFECPACASFSPIFSQVKEQFKDQVRFEFKHFPLVQIHQNAIAAHRATQAAASQGKFWEMHDILYERQQLWGSSTNSSAVFEEYARELELNMDEYTATVGTSETLAVINADIAAGKALGVNSTPTFLIDGEIIEDVSQLGTVEGFANLIQQAIDKKLGVENQETSVDNTTEEALRPEETDSVEQ